MPRVRGREAFYEACSLFVEACLREGRSLFTPDREIWGDVPVTGLYERFVEHPDAEKGDFVPKLVGQLEGAPAKVVQLAAEMLYVLLLPQETGGTGKRQQVETVLQESPAPVPIPDELLRALDRGIASFGPALAHKFFQYVFLCEFSRAWVRLQPEQRDELLADGFAFREFVYAVPHKAAQSQREALLHMVFPEVFEPIVSVDSKEKIASAFAAYVEDPNAPLDVRLKSIRAALIQELGMPDDFNFWDEGMVERWQDPKTGPEPPEPNGPGEEQDEASTHLVVKWFRRFDPQTIELHREIAEQEGVVWWPLLGQGEEPFRFGEQPSQELRSQLDAGRPTYVFIALRDGSCWRTRLLQFELEQDAVDPALVPADYEDVPRWKLAWLKTGIFEETTRDELLRELDPVKRPGKPLALSNPVTPLIVRLRLKPRVWWVNQGSTYFRARDGAYLWAPIADKNGREHGHWRTMRHLRVGDIVLNYKDNRIRAWSTVRAEATPSPRPDPEADSSWTDDGFRAEVDYHELETPVNLSEVPIDWRKSEGGPFDTNGAVKQGYLFDVSDEFAARLQAKFPQLSFPQTGSQAPITTSPPPSLVGELELTEVMDAVTERGLLIASSVLVQAVAALRSGKHVIFTGPPGTAKTTLAQVIGSVASAQGLCDGYVLTTATADWTTYETIGGLKPDRSGGLSFQEGHFLEAIEKNQWLVIDELNRSNFDRAFGQLFTVLSGQAVELPYEREEGSGRVALVPAGASHDFDGADVIEVPSSWRVIATMNVFDKSLLFEMSFALMRRFAFVEIPSPRRQDFETLIDQQVEGDEAAAVVAKQLLALRVPELKDLGPAVFMDLARFVRERRALAEPEPGELAFEAFYSYLLPQFEGIDDVQGERLFKEMRKLVGPTLTERLRATLVAVLGLESLTPSPEPDSETNLEEVVTPDEPELVESNEPLA